MRCVIFLTIFGAGIFYFLVTKLYVCTFICTLMMLSNRVFQICSQLILVQLKFYYHIRIRLGNCYNKFQAIFCYRYPNSTLPFSIRFLMIGRANEIELVDNEQWRTMVQEEQLIYHFKINNNLANTPIFTCTLFNSTEILIYNL